MNNSTPITKSLAYNYGLYLGLITILTAVLIYAFSIEPENSMISIVTTALTLVV